MGASSARNLRYGAAFATKALMIARERSGASGHTDPHAPATPGAL
jgi:hypothetical protein